jgi:hypothetical protein
MTDEKEIPWQEAFLRREETERNLRIAKFIENIVIPLLLLGIWVAIIATLAIL